jgi:NAD(P)-dependent dehydrogenase (short-subunit alcohol dehydrogenase family)
VKTLLLCGVSDLLSQHLAYQLSRDGHRLLVTGSNLEMLQSLDAALCQSELHRYANVTAPRDTATWVNEQHIGLDGAALLLPPPEASTSLLVPWTFNLRQVEQLVFGPIELLRELIPQLRRGKKPKRVLIVLPWNTPALRANPATALATSLWRTALPQLTKEVERDGVQLNVYFTTPVDEPAPDAPPSLGTSGSIGPDVDDSGPPSAIVPCETARLAAGWFSSAFAPLFNQFLEHPTCGTQP